VLIAYGVGCLCHFLCLDWYRTSNRRFDSPEVAMMPAVSSLGGMGEPVMSRAGSTMDDDFSSEDSITQTVRTFFPETWLWDLLDVG